MQQDRQQNQGIYQALLEACHGALRETAIRYFGRTVTYRGLFTQTERAARAFLRWGVRQGDAVFLCSTATPELLYALLALWKLGATPHLIPPGQEAEQVAHWLQDSGAGLFLLLDQLLPHTPCPAEARVQTVLLQATQSMPLLTRTAAAKAFQTPEAESGPARWILWKEFLESGQSILNAPAAASGEAQAALVLYPPGRAGGEAFAHGALWARAVQMADRLRPWGGGRKLLCLLPPWQEEGVACGLLAPLCQSLTVVMEPRLHPAALGATLLGETPAHLVAEDALWPRMMAEPSLLRADLCFLHSVSVVQSRKGEGTVAPTADFLKTRHCKATVAQI